MLAALALIRSLQTKTFASIRLAPTLSALAGRAAASLTTSIPGRAQQTGGRAPRCHPSVGRLYGRTAQATWQQLALGRLPRAADGAVIVLRVGVGDPLQQGAPVADLDGGEVADASVLAGLDDPMNPPSNPPWSCCATNPAHHPAQRRTTGTRSPVGSGAPQNSAPPTSP